MYFEVFLFNRTLLHKNYGHQFETRLRDAMHEINWKLSIQAGRKESSSLVDKALCYSDLFFAVIMQRK